MITEIRLKDIWMRRTAFDRVMKSSAPTATLGKLSVIGAVLLDALKIHEIERNRKMEELGIQRLQVRRDELKQQFYVYSRNRTWWFLIERVRAEWNSTSEALEQKTREFNDWAAKAGEEVVQLPQDCKPHQVDELDGIKMSAEDLIWCREIGLIASRNSHGS